MKAEHARMHILRPVLKHIGLWSEAAENLLLMTAATESNLGEHLVQIPSGPARGWMQIETATEFDVHTNWLQYRPEIRARVLELLPEWQDGDAMVGNLFYAAAIARVIYRRAAPPLPAANDWPGLARYWKVHYNTVGGKGTVEKCLADAKRLNIAE
jgi:hypothetical protein